MFWPNLKTKKFYKSHTGGKGSRKAAGKVVDKDGNVRITAKE